MNYKNLPYDTECVPHVKMLPYKLKIPSFISSKILKPILNNLLFLTNYSPQSVHFESIYSIT